MAERAEFQFQLLEGGEIVARACTIPIRWDGTLDDLREGLDAALVRGFEDEAANALCAMLIAITRSRRGRRVSTDACIHERLGRRILRPAPRSVRIMGTVGEWEEWTGMAFPESGEYVLPGGLATVEIDRERDVGCYWEPNLWMQHRVPEGFEQVK
jgi:hypothetical protein